MSLRAMRLSGKRRLLAIALTVVGLIAMVAVTGFMLFGPKTALGSGTGGGGCISTTGPACTFQGNSAFIDFGSVSSDNCVYTDAEIQVYDNLTRPGQNATKSVTLFISEWDGCTGNLIAEASNYDPNTGVPSFNGSFQFGSNLSSLTVNGTATMYDWNNNPQQFTTTINITVNGYGPSSKYSDSQHFQAPGMVMNSHFTGISRSAEASGTFTDLTGTNLAATPSIYASLEDSSGGTVQIFKY